MYQLKNRNVPQIAFVMSYPEYQWDNSWQTIFIFRQSSVCEDSCFYYSGMRPKMRVPRRTPQAFPSVIRNSMRLFNVPFSRRALKRVPPQ